jgi:hypothetical protein
MIELQKTPFPKGQKWGFFVSCFVSYSFPNPFPLSARRKRFRFLFRFLKPQETATRFLLMQKCIRKRALFGGCFQVSIQPQFCGRFSVFRLTHARARVRRIGAALASHGMATVVCAHNWLTMIRRKTDDLPIMWSAGVSAQN